MWAFRNSTLFESATTDFGMSTVYYGSLKFSASLSIKQIMQYVMWNLYVTRLKYIECHFVSVMSAYKRFVIDLILRDDQMPFLFLTFSIPVSKYTLEQNLCGWMSDIFGLWNGPSICTEGGVGWIFEIFYVCCMQGGLFFKWSFFSTGNSRCLLTSGPPSLEWIWYSK